MRRRLLATLAACTLLIALGPLGDGLASVQAATNAASGWSQWYATQGGTPGLRSGAAMAYDAATGTVVLFGGCCNPFTNGESFGDTWTWDGNTWMQQQPTTDPPARFSPALAYDAALEKVILFGGASNALPLDETWAWDGHDWSRLVLTPPPARANASLVVDPTIGGLVLFGGQGAHYYLGDMWLFGPVDAAPPAPHDARYFAQTGFRIDDATIWDYFTHRGGVNAFGYPISRTFLFAGSRTQFFQRRIVQVDAHGDARQMNLLDPGLLSYDHINGATFPPYDPALVATVPATTDVPTILAWVRAHAPDTFEGMPVGFDRTFENTVAYAVVFGSGVGNPRLMPGFQLEMWGVPTSEPALDPTNHAVAYLRFQRGIMMYDARCQCTQGVLLADYLKSILTGQNLPADLAQEAADSPLLGQYDPTATNWVQDRARLPDTDLTNAFTPE